MKSLKSFLLPLRQRKDTRRTEQLEKLKDDFHEHYYTECAKKHINRILDTYNRERQESFQTSLESIKNLGLFNPCADNIKYLKHMRWVSMKSR